MFTLKRSLQNKLILLALLPAVVITSILTVYMATTRIDDIESLTREKADAIAQQIASDNVTTIFTRNKPQLEKKIETYFAAYDDLMDVNIFSSDTLFSHSKSKNNPIIAPQVSATSDIKMPVSSDSLDDFDFHEADIQTSSSVIGTVQIWLADKSVPQKNEIILTSVLILLVTLSTTLLFVFPMTKKLTHPIQNLVKAFDSLGQGEYETRVQEESSDELLTLQRGFNKMSAALSQQHEELNEQVEQVTSDLQSTMQVLEIQNVELDIARKQAIESSRVKSEFLANMSHEIRTPMNGVVGFTGLLKKTRLNNLQQQYLQTIDRSAKSLLQILNDILDFSKLEAGKIEIDAWAFDVEDFITEVISIFTPLAHEKQLNLIPIIYNDIPTHIIGDRMRALQVLSNLISNAIKFTQKGDVVLRVILESIADKECQINFSVTDTGIGIPADKQEVLFRPFRQISSDLNRGFGGTGLGLSISKSLIDMMGGTITFESNRNIGSTFKAILPFDLVAPDVQASAVELPELFPFRERVLLLLDKHPLSRASLSNMFIQLGFSVGAPEEFDLTTLDLSETTDCDIIIISMRESELELLDKNTIQKLSDLDTKYMLLLNSSEQKNLETYAQKLKCPVLKLPLFKKQIIPTLKDILGETDVSESSSHESLKIQKNDLLKSKKILIVDDNIINQQLLSALLGQSGASITLATNGFEALNRFESETFDLVFMDIHMPVINGIETTAKLRDAGHTMPIIALTADVAFKEAKTPEHYGFDNVLIKPIEVDALYRILETTLDTKHIARQQETNHPTTSSDLSANQGQVRDIEQALRITGGLQSVADKLLNQLAEQIPDYMTSLQEEFEKKDWQQLWEILHKLHGATSVCGVPAFNSAVNNVQKLIRNADYLLIERELEKLKDEAQRLIDYVKK